MKKNVVIFIPGTESSEDGSKLSHLFIKLANNIYSFIVNGPDNNTAWKNFLGKFGIVEVFKWDGRPSLKSVKYSLEALEEQIDRFPEKTLIIVAESLGSEIVLSCENLWKVRKLILFCPVNKKRIINDLPVLEVYSRKDNFAVLGKRYFWPFKHSLTLRGNNVISVDVSPLRHKDFTPSLIGKYISDFLI